MRLLAFLCGLVGDPLSTTFSTTASANVVLTSASGGYSDLQASTYTQSGFYLQSSRDASGYAYASLDYSVPFQTAGPVRSGFVEISAFGTTPRQQYPAYLESYSIGILSSPEMSQVNYLLIGESQASSPIYTNFVLFQPCIQSTWAQDTF